VIHFADLFPWSRVVRAYLKLTISPRRTQICLCGSKETTYLSSLLAKHWPWDHKSKKNESCEDCYEARWSYLSSLCKSSGIETAEDRIPICVCIFETKKKTWATLAKFSANTIAVRIEVAIHSTEERFSVYDDRVLDGCKTSKRCKMILFRDIRRAPKKKRSVVYLILLKAHRLLMHPISRDEIDDYHEVRTTKVENTVTQDCVRHSDIW
jgi:hypothetical protein